MGKALAEAAIAAGHEAVVVSGPVGVRYPRQAEVISVVSTEEMLAACLKVFPTCAGLIAAAAPCDYRPKTVAARKIRKTGGPLEIELVETPDIVARLGRIRKGQWMVAFALETEDRHLRAMRKLEQKNCDWIVVNGPEAICAARTRVEVLDAGGAVLAVVVRLEKPRRPGAFGPYRALFPRPVRIWSGRRDSPDQPSVGARRRQRTNCERSAMPQRLGQSPVCG